jgi:hypothetical protein
VPVLAAAVALVPAAAVTAAAAPARARTTAAGTHGSPAGGSTVWLCRPGLAQDPCTTSLTTTVVPASGATTVARTADDPSSPFDCFYVYPTVSPQHTTNADLRVQPAEVDVAVAQAARFSSVCRVWAPVYRQVTLQALARAPTLRVPAAATATAYTSLRSAFEDYLEHDNHGRPIVFLGHSQGAAMLILLLQRLVDGHPSLRRRTVMAIILGGNVEVRDGSRTGGTFRHLPTCSAPGQAGCVIAYSSFPGEPPAGALFGRPGRGVSLQSGQTATKGLQVACVNPAAIRGGTGRLDPFFPSLGTVATPWVSYPGRYLARCRHAGGATWLQVRPTTTPSGRRPTVTEQAGPEWGYHTDDVNLALGNLVADVAAAERTWSARAGRRGTG